MRAILIDPKEQTVTEVEWNGDHQHIYTLIGATCFDAVRINSIKEGGDTIYVDDEGLINGRWQRDGMFRFDGDNPAYLAGKGLILGTDNTGESVATRMAIEAVKARVAFGRPNMLHGQAYFQQLNSDGFTVKRSWRMD